MSRRRKSGAGNDSRFFTTTKKGEIHELKEQLHNPDKNRKMEAVKKLAQVPDTTIYMGTGMRLPYLRAVSSRTMQY